MSVKTLLNRLWIVERRSVFWLDTASEKESYIITWINTERKHVVSDISNLTFTLQLVFICALVCT